MKTIQTAQEFQTAAQDPISLFLFKTKNCGVCAAIAPKVEALMRGYPAVSASIVWADAQPMISGQQLVFSVPAVLLFKDGREIHRQSRFIDFEELKRQIDQAL